MRISSHRFRVLILSLALGFSWVLPCAASAEPEGAPLVVVRFNQPHVYYDQQLYSAISKAVAIKPDLMFDVVSYAPATGAPETDKQWQAVAGSHTRAVIDTMVGMGVPMARISVTGQSRSGLRYDETHVFVH